ncbi:hypothetical protein PLICRDRAFT_37894 [Plicaturopsis crispa FD-325 SS-3]|nr:hypothetical protein PLICRDRAFT_37894 [Plicaturopsis crispa FD-325 SS-3]
MLVKSSYWTRTLRRTFVCHRRNLSSSRPHSAEKSTAPVDNKAFSATLLLPETAFPLYSDPSEREVLFQGKTCEDLYQWQWNNAQGPLFVFHDGPPYANGRLHMGHALNKIIKDIINRYQVLQGRKVHYMPGWDCHGLPIESKTLKELGKNSRLLPPSTIRAAAKATAEREIAIQRDEFRRLGIMADWSQGSTYRTLDRAYEIRQLRVFQKMVERGLIYRHYRPVHYSPSSRSALAEAELEYNEEHISHSVYVSFVLIPDSKASASLRRVLTLAQVQDLKTKVLVWTSTPWTLTANMGIAVHPDLAYSVVKLTTPEHGGDLLIVATERVHALAKITGPVDVITSLRGSDLLDATYLPIFHRLNPGKATPFNIIPASHVNSKSGTGLVHCAPAHGAEDYTAFRSQGLISSDTAMLCHVDGEGKFTQGVIDVVGADAAESLIGNEVLKGGSTAVVELLRQTGTLWAVEKYKHKYPYDWKTKKPIIVTATSQWFANLENIKDDALGALQDVNFIPQASRNRLQTYVRDRSEWCISRQRVWGVPIPALRHVPSDTVILDSTTLSHILPILSEKGVEYWWDGPAEEFVPPSLAGRGGPWEKGTDTMDVWFDSGSSWSMLEETGFAAPESGRRHLADVCLEGSDQHRGWFQSQLLTCIGSNSGVANPASPYGTLITHGMVLDEKGKKMSKSDGNIISPMTIINGGKDKQKNPAYGADVLRLWAATVEYSNDMPIGPTVLSQCSESLRRIRNSARFILGNIGDAESRRDFIPVPREAMGLIERYVMNELYNVETIAREGYESYNFAKAMTALINLANVTLSSFYLDITKDCLYANALNSPERRAVVTVLAQTLSTITSVMAPVLPHLAEEIHHINQRGTDKAAGLSVFATTPTPLGAEWHEPEVREEMDQLLGVRSVVLSLLEQARQAKQLKNSLEAEVDLIVTGDAEDSQLVKLLRDNEDSLKTIFIVSDAYVENEGSLGTSSPEWVYTTSMAIPGCEDELGIRVRPSTLAKCPRCWTYSRPPQDVLCGRCATVVPH